MSPGPVRLTSTSQAGFRPAISGVISGGLWAERRRVNREVSVPQGWDRLHEAGNFHNLELAAGLTTGAYVNDLPFLDSDVYKWLEAIGWTLADPDLSPAVETQLRGYLDATTRLLTAAQQPDGYLDSNFQVRHPSQRFVDLQWGHELYCAGHLVQAAVALHRTTNDQRVLEIARRFADLVVASFGAEDGQIDGVCGHPEIETALVELYRETGHEPYLETARFFVDRRGHGLLGPDRFGAQYWQDHLPVRDAPAVEGHAVRQLYLLAGVADVYLEGGDDTLATAAERLWHEMVTTRTYLTGGIGSHHSDEAFGDPYELPNERSYCETCAAIASIMFSWRMLLTTGEARYADLLERTLYNGFLAGLSLDGQSYIYANPLQVRDGHVTSGNDGDYQRRPWFACACCPPNVMRTLASLEHYVVISRGDQVRVHQFVEGAYAAAVAGGEARLTVETNYPWEGRVRIVVESTPGGVWGLGVRVPQWATDVAAHVNGSAVPTDALDGWLVIDRDWTVGDELVVDLPLDVRLTRADDRVDADRGSVAVERGPLVYCLEAVDHPGQRLDDVALDPSVPPVTQHRPDLLGGVVTVQVQGVRRVPGPETSWWPYADLRAHQGAGDTDTEPLTLSAVPYFTWGNREPGAMRVFVPSAATGTSTRSGR